LGSISRRHFPGEDHLIAALESGDLDALDDALGRRQRGLALSAA
jgi:hypothetical protein